MSDRFEISIHRKESGRFSTEDWIALEERGLIASFSIPVHLFSRDGFVAPEGGADFTPPAGAAGAFFTGGLGVERI